ncbi:MAG: sulfotransferase [Saprospiraceae bacterium]|nr:sulfotransferase [Saprospiraceae bacterium]
MQKIKLLWHKIYSRAFSFIINLFAHQTNFDISNTVLLLGSTRSGTTFLMESINAHNDYRLIFEPFNPTYTKEWGVFTARHYINPNRNNARESQVVEKILSGRINNHWVDQFNRKIRSQKRLIKSVRGNLMLDYFETKYPELTILYVYRNPYDVVASRMNLQFDSNDVFLLLNHLDFINKYYSDIDISSFKALLSTPESCHAALWCLENCYILDSLPNRKLIAVKYEDVKGKMVLLKKGELLISNTIRRPSVTTSFQEAYQLSKKEVKNIRQVLIRFNIDEYYA